MKFTAVAEPTRRAALLALAERVEQAAEGSDELDRDISRLLPDDLWAKGGAWTASLDAALSLVPEGAAWQVRNMHDGIIGGHAWVYASSRPTLSYFDIDVEVHAATPALALTAAALRARAAMEEGGA